MITIYKYPLYPSPGIQEIKMPNAKVISAGIDGNGQICIWAEVDTTEKNEVIRNFWCVGTGWDISEIFHFKKIIFIGTVVDIEGLVWHIYETAGTASLGADTPVNAL